MRGGIVLIAWVVGALITLLLLAAGSSGNHILGIAYLFLLPPFLAAERITGKRMWDFTGDPQTYCLTILFGGLFYGLLVLPLVRYWNRHWRMNRDKEEDG
ncbi:MAG TPA: hypothetical protein VGF49_15680 [Candidatus Solibacter sp.]|jgi:hypothetical protein